MDSGNIKLCKIQARKVTQDVLVFLLYKQGLIPKQNLELSFVPEITSEFLNNLRNSIWIESICNVYVWGDFLENHYKRMTKTPYLFANYFAYASYMLVEKARDVHSCFIDILSLVTHFTLYCWQEGDENFLNCCVELFCAFFDKELSEKFEMQGRWKSFDEYLKNEENLKMYNEQIHAKKPQNEIFNEFQSRYLESNEPYIMNGVVIKDITEDEVENQKDAVSFADSITGKLKEIFKKTLEEVLQDFRKTDEQVEKLYRQMAGEASGGMSITEDQSSQQKFTENAFLNLPEIIARIVEEEFQDTSFTNVANKTYSKKNKGPSKKQKGQETSKDFTKTDRRQEKTDLETVGVTSGEIISGGDQPSLHEVQKEALENVSSKTNFKKINNRLKDDKATDSFQSRAPHETDLSPKSKVERAKSLLQEMLIDTEKIFELIKFVCQQNSNT